MQIRRTHATLRIANQSPAGAQIDPPWRAPAGARRIHHDGLLRGGLRVVMRAAGVSEPQTGDACRDANRHMKNPTRIAQTKSARLDSMLVNVPRLEKPVEACAAP